MQAQKALPVAHASSSAPLDAEALFRDHARFVASFLRHLGTPTSELDDLVQEVFVVVHQKGGYAPGPASPRSWLAAIAFRVAQSGQRARLRRPPVCEPPEALAHDARDAAEVLELQRRLQQVENALARLSLEQRATFVLYEIEGESCESIADMWNVPVGTVYSRLHHARQRFFKAYQRGATRERHGRSLEGRLSPLLAPIGLAGELRLPCAYEPSAQLARLRAAWSNTRPSGAQLSAARSAQSPTWLAVHGTRWAMRLGLLVVAGGASMAAFSSSSQPERHASTEPLPMLVDATSAAPAPLEAPAAPASEATRAALDRPKTPSMAAAPRDTGAAHDPRREIELIVRLRALLERDPAGAYRLAERTAREFQHGALDEEREALKVLALAKLGDARARQKAQRFVARYPESPLRPRLEALVDP